MAHSGTCESLPGKQPPRQITLHLQPPVGLTQPGIPPGWLWTSATISPCISARTSPPATSGNTPPAHRRYSRRKISFPLRRSHHEAARLRWRTRRACARIADSVSVMGFTAKVVNGKEAAKVADIIAELTATRHLLHLSFVISDVGWSYSSAPPDRDNRTHHRDRSRCRCWQHDAPRKNSAVRFRRRGQYKEALTALSSLHCSMRQRLITSAPDRRHCFR